MAAASMKLLQVIKIRVRVLHRSVSFLQLSQYSSVSLPNSTVSKRNNSFGNESFSEANRRSAYQEIIRILWNAKIHYRVHNSLSLIRILSQMNPVPPLFF
jgi:hypothetical protein